MLASFVFNINIGKEIGLNFISFSLNMLKILPCAFILIGLFEVWVKRETVERYLGDSSGLSGFFWAILLAGTTVGGLYVALPFAFSLYKKGAKLNIILTYLGASEICRIPMTIFEASFLGIKFSAIRFMVSLPLLIAASILLGGYLSRRKYMIPEDQ